MVLSHNQNKSFVLYLGDNLSEAKEEYNHQLNREFNKDWNTYFLCQVLEMKSPTVRKPCPKCKENRLIQIAKYCSERKAYEKELPYWKCESCQTQYHPETNKIIQLDEENYVIFCH
jgi:transposase-like protein